MYSKLSKMMSIRKRQIYLKWRSTKDWKHVREEIYPFLLRQKLPKTRVNYLKQRSQRWRYAQLLRFLAAHFLNCIPPPASFVLLNGIRSLLLTRKACVDPEYVKRWKLPKTALGVSLRENSGTFTPGLYYLISLYSSETKKYKRCRICTLSRSKE